MLIYTYQENIPDNSNIHFGKILWKNSWNFRSFFFQTSPIRLQVDDVVKPRLFEMLKKDTISE